MAKGFQEHQERVNALNLLGKELARRAKSKCEVCEAAGVPLRAFEVPPEPKEPDLDHCAFVCETCFNALSNPKQKLIANEWRTLGNTIWGEVESVQVCVVRLLRRIAEDAAWAQEILDEAYLDPEVEDWASKSA
ncbi:MAG: phnA protein [Verrucomicrobiota bacterium]